ncbi:MAG: 30S ribosomal protein S6 [Erysipelotrichaceae bacterium]|nr:30S ribosomal protein S6 [Erysipelotrichaceae bacterium]
MRQYEVMYILNANLEEAARNEVINSLHAILTTNGGEIENVDEWGLREFAYEIDGMKKGYYVVTTFKSDAANVAEFERVARINDSVIRTMMLCLEDVKK